MSVVGWKPEVAGPLLHHTASSLHTHRRIGWLYGFWRRAGLCGGRTRLRRLALRILPCAPTAAYSPSATFCVYWTGGMLICFSLFRLSLADAAAASASLPLPRFRFAYYATLFSTFAPLPATHVFRVLGHWAFYTYPTTHLHSCREEKERDFCFSLPACCADGGFL